MGNITGGQSLSTFHKVDPTHTTVTTAAELTLDEQTKTDLNKDQFNYDTIKFDGLVLAFINSYASIAGGGSDIEYEKVQLETGLKKDAGQAAGKQNFISISYGGTQLDGTDLMVLVTVGLGTLSGDSGDFSLEVGKFIRPKFMLDLVAALKNITLVKEIWDATKVDITDTDVIAGITFPKGIKKRAFLIKAQTT